MRKTILTIVAVLVAIVGVLVILRGWRARRVASGSQYETVAVRRDTLVATVNTSGSVSPKQKVSMVFPSAGLLEKLLVEPGQTVRAGDELAALDARQLELSVVQAEATLQINEARLAQTRAGSSAADIASAEAAAASAQAAYDSAKKKMSLRGDQLTVVEADLEKAELALKDAQAAYDLVAWRPDIGALPQSAALQRATLDHQRALANYNLQVAAIDDTAFKGAAAQLAQAKAQLDRLNGAPTPEELAIAEAQVKQAAAALEQAKLRLKDATLVAPFDGTVLATSGQVGELVGTAVPVVVLADLGSYYIDTSIDETDIGRVQVGQDVDITLDAFPDATLRGKVVRVEPMGKATQGVVSYDVRVEVLSNEEFLRPNMTAMVDIVIERKEGILVVPNRAIKRDTRGRRYVQILKDGKAEERTVTVGLSNELVTEISEGLVEGEEVVVNAPRENVLSQFGQFRTGGSGQ